MNFEISKSEHPQQMISLGRSANNLIGVADEP
jgi:hypothetical protein